MPRNSHFNPAWLEDSKYKDWIRKKDDTTAFCRYCQKDVSVGNGGEIDLKRHSGLEPFSDKGKMHKLRSPVSGCSMKTMLQSSSASSVVASDKEVGNDATTGHAATSTSSIKQSSIDTLLEKDCITNAEIIWSLKVVSSKYSQRSCDDITEVIAAMCPDSEIAKKMTLKRVKIGYVINFGIAPYFEELLLSEVKASPFFVLSFDESLNKALQKEQMDILIRYWNAEKCIAVTRYLTSEFLGGAKAEQILDTFERGVNKKIENSAKLLQISSDGPNVNLRFLTLYSEKRQFNELPTLLNIGTCGLHTVHGSLKAAVKASDWKIGKVLKAMHKILDETPARRDIFERVTETNVYPLNYCGHRWCENEGCLHRAEVIWPAFVKFIKHLEKLPKAQQPGQGQGKSFILLRESVNDPLMLAKMNLIEFLSNKLNHFLRGFQTDQPMVPFLAETLEEILRSIMNMFILAERMEKAHTQVEFMKIDVNDINIQKAKDTIDIGMAAKVHVAKYKKANGFKQSVLISFWNGARSTLSALTSHMLEKSPLKYSLLRLAAAINPSLVVSKTKKELSKLRFLKLLERLVTVERITAKEGDDAKEQYFKFIHEVVPANEEKFLAFNKFKCRLDTFYAEYLVGEEFKDLWKVFVILFCLSHGQSPIERGFKANKEFSTHNQGVLSLKALRVVHDHMQANEIGPHTIKINNEMRKSVRRARWKYGESLKEQQNEKVTTEKELKRKIIGEELKEIQKKRKFLESSISDLRRDADVFALDAGKKQDFQLLQRSNDLRSIVSSKESDIAELNKMEESLLIRRESIL